jgi:hypothetical protein
MANWDVHLGKIKTTLSKQTRLRKMAKLKRGRKYMLNMSALLAEDSSLLHCSFHNPSTQPELLISQICYGYCMKKASSLFFKEF